MFIYYEEHSLQSFEADGRFRIGGSKGMQLWGAYNLKHDVP